MPAPTWWTAMSQAGRTAVNGMNPAPITASGSGLSWSTTLSAAPMTMSRPNTVSTSGEN
nr:hypothetical protein [Actinacidiphila soli]